LLGSFCWVYEAARKARYVYIRGRSIDLYGTDDEFVIADREEHHIDGEYCKSQMLRCFVA
jgi:hypothetical protein